MDLSDASEKILSETTGDLSRDLPTSSVAPNTPANFLHLLDPTAVSTTNGETTLYCDIACSLRFV